jgi:hypothetical protein
MAVDACIGSECMFCMQAWDRPCVPAVDTKPPASSTLTSSRVPDPEPQALVLLNHAMLLLLPAAAAAAAAAQRRDSSIGRTADSIVAN